MDNMMDYFRYTEVKFPVGKLVAINDYLLSVRKSAEGESEIKLPKSNVLKYVFEDGTTATIRPSGTEPKIKIYYCGKDKEVIAQLKAFFDNITKA